MGSPMSDRRITELCKPCELCDCISSPMIEPFEARNIRRTDDLSGDHFGRVISYGTSSYGYDMRVAGEFKIFTNLHTGVIDPKNFNTLQFHEVVIEEGAKDNFIIIPPNAFALARTVEWWCIPRNVVGIVLGKSTYARCGLVANITALEPEWEGHLTIELSNTAPLPIKVYAFEGIAQAIFFESDYECETSYADKAGKYQGQQGITLPKV